MVIPIFKKNTIIENKTKQQMKDIAEKIPLEDKIQIDNILNKIKKDARGRIVYTRNDATAVLVYFQKYIDPKVKGNIFGCGGCAQKMLNTMFNLQKEWQNQTT